MLKRLLTYCLLLLSACVAKADGVGRLGSIRRAATPLLLYSIEICYCSKEFGSLGVFSLRIVRQDGVVERTNHYYPYGGLHGESTGTTNHRFRFSGKEYDPLLGCLTSLTHLGNSVNGINSTAGATSFCRLSFCLRGVLSPDNYVQLPDLSQSFNRYSYCLNNPLKYTDPQRGIVWDR